MVFSTKSTSIKNQVNFVLIAGISLIFVILGFLSIKGVNQQTRELMLNNASQIAAGLAQQAIFPILSGSTQNANDAMRQVSGFQSVDAARILLDNGQTFLSQGDFTHIKEHPNHVNFSPSNQFKVILETEDFWLLSIPVFLNSQEATASSNGREEFELEQTEFVSSIIGYTQLIYSKNKLHDIQTRVAITVSAVGFIAILVLNLAIHLALSHLFRPLDKLAKIMHQSRITGEHLQADVSGAIEITEMADAYNSMMKVLDTQDDALKQHRDKLEEEVELRTQEIIIARDAAIEASKHKSEFIANMSHELRTPIQSIIGYGELVMEELELEGHPILVDDMEKIANNSQRLLQMINSLLDLAKIESGHMELNKVELNLQSFIKSIVDIISPISYKNNNKFVVNNCIVQHEVIIDKEKLEHIVLNLLSNACKFTENGQIILSLTTQDNHLIITVADTGLGLSEEQQSFIFDEFRQVDASQKRQFGGTGLGLAISKRFIDIMSGELMVESSLGKGAKFTIKLPYHIVEHSANI